MHGRICIVTLILIAGCTEVPAPTREPEPPTSMLAQAFDAQATGTIRGQVCWDGDMPVAEEYLVRSHATNPYLYKNPARFTLPHHPKVDAKSKGVEHAVVFLRKVEAKQSKPWDLASVCVEFKQRQLAIVQGERRAGVGFVQRGSAVEMVNRDSEYHNLLGRGAAFFAEPLIIQDRVSKRTLTQAGIVDLSSANGYYWLHAHLFVVDHPYYACTDADGRFTLEQVPSGSYELVCWMPNWHVEQKERDPETGTFMRMRWAPPQEQIRNIEMDAGKQIEVEYRWNQEMFDLKNN